MVIHSNSLRYANERDFTSYLYETPLSTNINARIHNRQHPPGPNTIPVETIAEMDASWAESTRLRRIREAAEEKIEIHETEAEIQAREEQESERERLYMENDHANRA